MRVVRGTKGRQDGTATVGYREHAEQGVLGVFRDPHSHHSVYVTNGREEHY